MSNFVEQRFSIFMLSDCQGVYKQIITGDESWSYAYDPEITGQSNEYLSKGEDKPKRPKWGAYFEGNDVNLEE